MKISFVLLIKIRSHHDHNELDRLKNIQLKSFRKFLDLAVLQHFFIVASQEDIAVIKVELLESYPEFPFVFVVENELCPSIAGGPGWTKQMILKIAVANLVQTDCYLTLDTDVFLTRPLGAEDILVDGKLSYQKEAPGSHRSWWESSSHVLQVEPDLVLKKSRVMGVTPEYLVTEVSRKLQGEIETLHGTKDYAAWLMARRVSKKSPLNRFVKKLSRPLPLLRGLIPAERREQIATCDWTEYTLYWTYLNKMGMVEKYYAENERQVYGNCIWVLKDKQGSDLRELVDKAFRDNAGYHFSLVQSSIENLDQAYLAQLIGGYLA
jgi:hypothetical protein